MLMANDSGELPGCATLGAPHSNLGQSAESASDSTCATSSLSRSDDSIIAADSDQRPNRHLIKLHMCS